MPTAPRRESTGTAASTVDLGLAIRAALDDSYQVEDGLGVAPGDIVAIVGESGVGKSFFVRTVASHLVERMGLECTYVPQTAPFFPGLSTAKNIALLSGRRDADFVMSTLPGLTAGAVRVRANSSPTALSGGERRLVLLACALVRGGELAILDETLVSLDPGRMRWAIRRIRSSIAERSLGSVFIVTHDIRVIAAADRVLEIAIGEDGRRRIGCKQQIRSTDESMEEAAQRGSVAGSECPSPRSVRRSAVVRLGAAIAVALVCLCLLMILARHSVTPRARPLMPTISGVAEAIWKRRARLAHEGIWTLTNAIVAFVAALSLACLYWVSGVMSENTRRRIAAVWVALQAIPVIVLAPLVVVIWGASGRPLEITIAVFIASFPLGLVGARALAATSEELFLAHRARGLWSRYLVASRFARAELVRAAVAMSPLAAVGVTVAEYLAPDRGLGAMLQRTVAAHANFTVPFAIVAASVAVALTVLTGATLLGLVALPGDVSPE